MASSIFPADFIILDHEVDVQVYVILGRAFLATVRALVDMVLGQMRSRLNNYRYIIFAPPKSKFYLFLVPYHAPHPFMIIPSLKNKITNP